MGSCIDDEQQELCGASEALGSLMTVTLPRCMAWTCVCALVSFSVKAELTAHH